MRMEQGESLEQIMESMGTAQEIADAFSQNLPEAEHKACQRKKATIIVGAIAAGLVLLGSYIWWLFPKPYNVENNEQLSEDAVAVKVEMVVRLLDENDFETLQTESVEELQNILTREVIDQVRVSMSDHWGERLAIGSTYMQGMKQKGKVLVVTQTDVMYENISVVYTITFDENLRLAGVYMR